MVLSLRKAPVVVAPFANERIREWPVDNLRRLIARGLEDDLDFLVSGTRAHRSLANDIVRDFPSHRVVNGCGQTSWAELQAMLIEAPFVVANNSGIAHQAAFLGAWVLCLFAGSHSWVEWMPRGARVVTLTASASCVPCERHYCLNGFACLAQIDPVAAYDEITEAIRRSNLNISVDNIL